VNGDVCLYIYLRNCLKVVFNLSVFSLFCLKVFFNLSVPYYILTLKNKGYSLSTALVRRGYSHTSNHLKTLHVFIY